jgi:PTH1 family peptidyl-tRNA hydrolase
VSNSFSQGRQVDYVLGQWSKEETSELIERLEKAKNLVKSFGTAGLKHTMNDYNGQ